MVRRCATAVGEGGMAIAFVHPMLGGLAKLREFENALVDVAPHAAPIWRHSSQPFVSGPHVANLVHMLALIHEFSYLPSRSTWLHG
jgi:hypothetical protein